VQAQNIGSSLNIPGEKRHFNLHPGLMKIEELYDIYKAHPKVITDSREPVQGSIFFGLRGEQYNGNQYAPDALNGGSSFAVVDDKSVAADERYILVENSLQTLQELATFHRQQLTIPVVAITGSNGKTTTKELAASILAAKYPLHATRGNQNNHIGVPLTLLGIDTGASMGIIEMGANHAGEIAKLCRMAMPDYGLITNIGRAHLEGFGSLEGVIRAKKELYDFLGERGGFVFINEQDGVLKKMLQDFEGGVAWYGGSGKSVISGTILASDPALTIRLDIKGHESWEIETGLVGSYNLENILAAACIGWHFGISPAQLRQAIQHYRTANNRSQQVSTERNALILDAYNANPTSMRAAIEDFSSMDHPAKSVILGDMLELGDASVEAHREIIELLERASFREVILVGPVFAGARVPDAYHKFSSVAACAGWLEEHPFRDRLVLMKGSRGMGLERLVGLL
jgi:UDP-N-acetylmuramoyl-tripeptide--D-alanyl-D-alanine ligase